MNLLLRKITLFKKLERTKNSIVGSTYLRTFIAHSRSGIFSDVIPNGKFTLAEISSRLF